MAKRRRDFRKVTAASARARSLRLIALILALLTWPYFLSPALAAEPKRVMLLHSFGTNFKPWSEYGKEIRSELERQSPWPLDITEQSLIAARFNDENPEAPFAEYLRVLFAKHPLDLIVSIGAPAAAFVQRHRQYVFPNAPMVFTAVEQRRVRYTELTSNDAVVAVKHDLPAVIENILRVLPGTKNVVVVNGTSPLEKFWLEEMKREFAPFDGRVEFTWTSDLSFDDILKNAAALPPQTAIFWELMILDAAGVVHQGDKALTKLHTVANAPIFSFDDSFFGKELVGGPMHSVLETSQKTAEVALRILGGEKAGDIKTVTIGLAAPKFDWREMQRWGISENSLPQGSEIHFRDPTVWEQYRRQILGICAAFVLQAFLIFWLIYEHWRRQAAEVAARNTMSELAQMNRVAGAGELSASIAHEVNQPLAAIAVQSAAALNWLKAQTPNVHEAQAALTVIASESLRAGDIVRNLRALFTKDTRQSTTLDINQVIASVLELMRIELQKRDIKVITELGYGLPLLMGFEVQLQQVIFNLVMNAKEAVQHASLPRELSIKSELNEGGEVQVSIRDSGRGIAPADLESVFKPLFTTKPNGMGMGLSICRSIIERHGGRIWVTLGQEPGTTFYFALPAA
jgi:signal transduction histidine kinase